MRFALALYPMNSFHSWFSVRLAQPSDATQLSILAMQCLWQAFPPADAARPQLGAVLDVLTPQRMKLRLAEEFTRIFVAEQNGVLLGYAVVGSAGECPHDNALRSELETVFVQSPYEGQGVGQALLLAAESLAARLGAGPLWLTVNPNNARALRFFERQAYAPIKSNHLDQWRERHISHFMRAPSARPNTKPKGKHLTLVKV